MRELINFCFKGGEKQFIAAAKFRATWTDNKSKFKITFDKVSLKLSINFFLSNCFFNFGSFAFRYITAILMSFDSEPFMANLSYITMKVWQIFLILR